jgi:hypothetical protein
VVLHLCNWLHGLLLWSLHDSNNQHHSWYWRTYPWASNCNSSRILLFGGYIKVRESLHIRMIIWFNAILYHSDTKTNLPKVWKFLHDIHPPVWYQKHKQRQVFKPYSYQHHEILITVTQMVRKKTRTKRYETNTYIPTYLPTYLPSIFELSVLPIHTGWCGVSSCIWEAPSVQFCHIQLAHLICCIFQPHAPNKEDNNTNKSSSQVSTELNVDVTFRRKKKKG